jgi:hypothetical protein
LFQLAENVLFEKSLLRFVITGAEETVGVRFASVPTLGIV